MPDGWLHLPAWLDGRIMADEFQAAREAAERQFRRYQQEIAQELARNVAGAFPGAPAAAPAPLSLADVSPADLHRLEEASSRVRHSIVETCFYNLRLYSGLLLERREKPGFREKLEANLAHLPDVREELQRYFTFPVGGTTLGALFPREEAQVMAELARLAQAAADLSQDFDDPLCLRRFADAAPRHIDQVMAALGQVAARLRAVKADLVGLLQEAVALSRERLAQANIAIAFTNQNGEAAPVFGRPRDLLSAFGELIQNAAKHGLADPAPGRARVVSVVLRQVTVGQQSYQIDVADSGCGIPPEVQAHLGRRGVTTGGTGVGLAMVRRIIETDHLGSLAILSRPGAGTLVRIHLPRTLAPAT